MWAVYFGDVEGGQVNSGIVVLETNRVFGGDSFMAYRGHYEASGNRLTGSAHIWAYNPTIEVQTAFGKIGTTEGETLRFDLERQEDGSYHGMLAEESNTAVQIPATFLKVAELP